MEETGVFMGMSGAVIGIALVLGVVLLLGVLGSSPQARSSRRFARRQRLWALRDFWKTVADSFKTEHQRQLEQTPKSARHTRALLRRRHRSVVRAKVGRVLVMVGVVVGGAVWMVGFEGFVSLVVTWHKPLLLGAVAAISIPLGLHFEKHLRQGYIPTWLGIWSAAIFGIWALVSAVRLWLA